MSQRLWLAVGVVASVVASLAVFGSGQAGGQATSACSQALAIPATAATPNLADPVGVAVDSAGNIYIVDSTTATVYRFDAAGTQTLAIAATAATPNLVDPVGVAVDPAGNIYIVDSTTATVYKFDAAGTQTLAIAATAATPNLVNPVGVAVDPVTSSFIYIVDSATATVYKFDAAGTQTSVIPATAATPNLVNPAGVALDPVTPTFVYIVDSATATLYEFDDNSGTQTLAIPASAATPNLSDPRGVAIGFNAYVTDPATATVYSFDRAGSQIFAIAATAASPNLVNPVGVALDPITGPPTGNIYVTDSANATIYRFDCSGPVSLEINKTLTAPPPAVDWNFEVSSSSAIPACVENNNLPQTVTVPAAGGTTSVALSVPLFGCEITVTELAVPGWEAVGNITQTLRVDQGSPPVTVSFTNQPIPIPITPIAPQFTG